MPLQGILIADIMESARENEFVPFLGSPAGQVVGAIHEIKPCRDILYDMVDEGHEVFEGLGLVGDSAGSPA